MDSEWIDENGEEIFEVHERVIWHSKGPAWVGRVIEVMGDSEYRVEFGNGSVWALHASDIATY